LSYIFNEFSKVDGGDVKFSEVVKIAKDKGYTVSPALFTRTM
jgi:homoserine dehydrogenase